MSMDIVLALGAGGVKGFSHLGVIKVLEQNGFRIRAVSGSSSGGMVGSVYAAGYTPDQMCESLVMIDQSRLYNRVAGDGPGIMGFSRVAALLGGFLGDRTFESLKIPFAVNAVNLETGQLEVLKTGRVLDAVRATTAVPGIFPPVKLEQRTLVDGGVIDPVPVGIARKLFPGVPVVAVVLSPPLSKWATLQKPPRVLSTFPLVQQLSQLRIAQSFNIFMRSVDIGGAMLTDMRLELDAPEVIIRPDVLEIGLLDRVDFADVMKRGERATQEAMPVLEELKRKNCKPQQNRRAWWNPFPRSLS